MMPFAIGTAVIYAEEDGGIGRVLHHYGELNYIKYHFGLNANREAITQISSPQPDSELIEIYEREYRAYTMCPAFSKVQTDVRNRIVFRLALQGITLKNLSDN
jgi:hypothetical protein